MTEFEIAMASSGGEDEKKHSQKKEALWNKIVTSAKKKIEESEKVGISRCYQWIVYLQNRTCGREHQAW